MTATAAFLSALSMVVSLLMLPAAAAGQAVEVMHSFSGCGPLGCAEDNDGAYPRSAMVRGADGALYGTTTDFPAGGVGTIFKMALSGARTRLFNFAAPAPPLTQPGCFPGYSSPLHLAADGHFYGVAGCGAIGDGTLFRISPEGSFTKLHDFDVDGSGSSNGGVNGGVVEGADGGFYGLTDVGAFGFGRAYRLNADGTISGLDDFTLAEGWSPIGNLVLASDGSLYGAALWGGLGNGTIFRLLPEGSLALVHAFLTTEGANPTGTLIQASDGRLYGTNSVGGGGCGTAFGMTLDGVVTLLHHFTVDEGCAPQSGLMQGQDGHLYGTTASAGASNLGTIYRLSTAGELTVLHSFSGPDGARPFGGLVQGDDGHLYGTTHYGGAHNLGVVFRLILPAAAITVLSPNGGERAFIGTPWTIRWDVAGAVSIDVEVSANGGSTYSAIPECTGLTGSATSCAWTPAGSATSKAGVRLTAHGAAGETATDVSDANFAVSTAIPAITVTAPNTAVTWITGSVQAIKWKHNLGGNSFVRIDVSRDGGGSWTPVAASVKNSGASAGAFAWTVAGPASSAALIRVSWLDGPVSDAGNVPFTIRQPTVKMSEPNTAVSWGIGGTRTLTWSHTMPPGGLVSLDVSRDGGATWSPIAAGVPNSGFKTGAYAWIVTGPATATARIRVRSDGDSSVSDAGDVDFTIADPIVAVIKPNTATSWRAGSLQAVKFSQNLGPGQAIDLELTRDGGATWEALATITTGTSLTATYSWLVTGPPSMQARVRARWTGSPVVEDESSVNFAILPRVTLTAPNTNVAWTAGETRSITWTHNLGASATVTLGLSRDGGATWETIAAAVSNSTVTSGSYTWLVTGPPTATALVRVTWDADIAEADVSNVTFRIQ